MQRAYTLAEPDPAETVWNLYGLGVTQTSVQPIYESRFLAPNRAHAEANVPQYGTPAYQNQFEEQYGWHMMTHAQIDFAITAAAASGVLAHAAHQIGVAKKALKLALRAANNQGLMAGWIAFHGLIAVLFASQVVLYGMALGAVALTVYFAYNVFASNPTLSVPYTGYMADITEGAAATIGYDSASVGYGGQPSESFDGGSLSLSITVSDSDGNAVTGESGSSVSGHADGNSDGLGDGDGDGVW